ncbi:MAG: trp operon repressor [Treponema sp.]|nr:trp operon repressor [Treponema sp.]
MNKNKQLDDTKLSQTEATHTDSSEVQEFVVTEELYQQTIDELCKIITESDTQLLKEFIDCLFTKAELHDIVNRWLLVKELDKGTTQRAIAKKFRMSLCKITRGSKLLNDPQSGFRKVLDKLK